jgi:hypothetical protein
VLLVRLFDRGGDIGGLLSVRGDAVGRRLDRIDTPRSRLNGLFERLLAGRSLATAPAAAPTSAVPPTIRGVLALDAASATACPTPFVLSIAVPMIESARVWLWAVDRDCGRGRVALVRFRAVLVPLARVPFEPLRFELDRFDAAAVPELWDLARAPFPRLFELLLVDFLVCAISLLVGVSIQLFLGCPGRDLHAP